MVYTGQDMIKPKTFEDISFLCTLEFIDGEYYTRRTSNGSTSVDIFPVLENKEYTLTGRFPIYSND